MSEAKKMNNIIEYDNLIEERWRKGTPWEQVAICDMTAPGEIIGMALNPAVTHICQSSHPYFSSDLNTAALMLNDVDLFARCPASSVLMPAQASEAKEKELLLLNFEFNKASQKPEILQSVENALGKTAASSSIKSDVVLIADELSTNAIFNAPFVDLENTLPGASRDDQSVQMSSGLKANVFLAADSTRIVIGCRDPYGTLNIDKLLNRVKRCYDVGVAETMRMTGKGGAGIGSFMVFNSAASYYVAVAEGQYTIVCCALPVKMSSRARQEMPKNLHYIRKK